MIFKFLNFEQKMLLFDTASRQFGRSQLSRYKIQTIQFVSFVLLNDTKMVACILMLSAIFCRPSPSVY